MAPNEPYVKKRSDAYTGILAISFLALVGATVFLYLEYQNYEGKTLPKTPVIDVPGARLQADPKSGGPPAPKTPPKVDNPQENPMPMPMPGMMMRNEPRPENTLPVLVPIEPVQTVQPAEIPVLIVAPPVEQVQLVVPVKRDEPIIVIPELPPPPAPVGEPVKAAEPKPIVPIFDPIPSDSPALPPVKRFDPPR
jgi:hypothetical protein